MQDNEVFKLSNICAKYDKKQVLDISSITIKRGKIYAIVGPNGAGKTTLLYILGMLKEPTSGNLYFYGDDGLSSTFNKLVARRKMSLILQEPYLFSGAVYKNIEYVLAFNGGNSQQRDKIVDDVLKLVRMNNHRLNDCRKLSGGEVKRVAIARALAMKPDILLLDEPTANLDKETVEIIESLIIRLRDEQRCTIIFTTHNYTFAMKLGDEIIFLENGKVVNRYCENTFRGKIESKNNVSWFIHSSGLQIEVVTNRTGTAVVSVNPNEVIVSTEPISSSARNNFRGKIVKLEEQNGYVKVAVDCGAEFNAIITRHSYLDMDLHLGQEVYVTFKVSVVDVI